MYLSNNYSNERYGIIDVSIKEDRRLDKIAILIVNAKGDVLMRNHDFLRLSGSNFKLDNLYNLLNMVDYIVGCDLPNIENALRYECEICGYSNFRDNISYLDAFHHPKINLPPLETVEDDPFHRIYKIKDLFVQQFNLRK